MAESPASDELLPGPSDSAAIYARAHPLADDEMKTPRISTRKMDSIIRLLRRNGVWVTWWDRVRSDKFKGTVVMDIVTYGKKKKNVRV